MVTMKRTGWRKQHVLRLLGISASQLSRWSQERVDRIRQVFPMHILEEEIQKVIVYRTSAEHVRSLGYRKFTWHMVDENIVYLSESAVYRVLRAHRLLGRVFKAHDGALKEYERKPLYVHHHWHTDIAYVIIRGVHYYLIFMLDGYSRYLLSWELMTDMSKLSVELFIQRTLDCYPGVKPMVIHDNGSQFVSHDFKKILFVNNCIDIPTRIKHPETNGKAERFVGLIRDEALRPNSPTYFAEAERVIRDYVYEYNNNRYHAGIKYLKPVDVFNGREKAILDERKQKLQNARLERIRINTSKNQILLADLPA